MITKIRKINTASISEAAKLINDGLPVAFVTETVYGLGANAYDQNAVAKIFEAKMRPSDNPLIVHISNISMLSNIVQPLNEVATKVVKHFFPSSLTVVLKKKSIIPSIVTAGLDTVAVRMPNNKDALRFINKCNLPIAAPSANTSTRPSPTRAIDVYNDLNGRIPLILDGGECEVGIESTVLDLSGSIPTILRKGMISASDISAVIGCDVKYLEATGTKVNSPGLRHKHYSPVCPLKVVTSSVNSAINIYNQMQHSGYIPVILTPSQYIAKLSECKCVNLGANDSEIAHNLFARIRDAESIYNYIIVFYPNVGERSVGIMDRLLRASGSNAV